MGRVGLRRGRELWFGSLLVPMCPSFVGLISPVYYLGFSIQRTQLISILNSAWRTRAPFKVEDWNNNLFLFRFESEEDKVNVLNDGPWSVMGSLLVLISLENAEINITKPLPKGFWLRGKDDPARDRWISFKYERLPDFCYACGRIGHDNRGCKFVSKEDGDKSGYGPELRTGRARRVDVSIEVIHEEGDAASARDENLSLQHSELLGDRAARGSVVGMERVMPLATGQIQLKDAGVREAHSTTGTDRGYSQRTAVVLPRATGKTLPIIPLSSPQGISKSASSGPSESLAVFGSDPSTEPNLPTINTKSAKPPSPAQNPSSNYFVTEPSDSPRALSPTQTLTYHNLNPPIPLLEAQTPYSSPSSENPTPGQLIPTKPVSPKSFEISLSQVFNSLNLIRKASEESLEPSRSKILRLCSPNPNPKPPNPKPSRPTRKQAKGNRRVIGPNRGSFSVEETSFLEDGLCDVQVHHSLTVHDVENAMVPGYSTALVAVDHDMEVSGIGRTVTSQALGDLVRRNRPSIVFLMETKNNKVKLEIFRRRLRFPFSFYVDPIGLSGGLALWWTNNVGVDVEHANKNLMHVVVNDKATNAYWASTFVYGCPSRSGRQEVWDCIKSIARSESLPWLCMGDFNQVLAADDKFGGHLPSQNALASFHHMISACGLVDLEFKGPKFTWRNNRSEDSFIMERIDMGFANSE
ncbi:hypothetical protein RHGRI_023918 [Rhododendron griersonianum]|uniref:CCHC-type domain-containing protein n=1 Tax=Rhododendron griersonianum TaxID=479676 RepID=A0AAV6J596_9ERIC|nr:hypothetical protein RHGRI_023918 [Rhododendron griersonianum]